MTMKVALVVGHKSRSPGAGNDAHPVSEFEFNMRLALDVWSSFYYSSDLSVTTEIVCRRTYPRLPGDINDIEPDFAVSLHANASVGHSASGTEVLYYHRSERSAKIASIFQHEFVDALGLRDRGIKPVDSEGRGGFVLKTVSCPIVICEPFFIDNDSDLRTALGADLAGAYINAIRSAAGL